MNRKGLRIKRVMLLILSLILALTSVYSVCIFADSDTNEKSGSEEKFVYKSSDAWPADGFAASDLKNNDPVWQFLYRDDQTATETASDDQYKAYTIAALGGANSETFAKPSENTDGTYNYEATGNGVIVYSDSKANPGMRNAMGKYWMRLSVAGSSAPYKSKENRIVKAFTAPKSGNVCVSAEDMSGAAKIYNKGLSSANNYGATVRVIKKSASADDETLWEHKFIYADKSIESVDFENITVYLNKDEQLWFVVSGEQAKNGWGMQVFWNPTVTYNYDAEEIEPSDLSAVPLEQNFTVTFPDELEELTADSISIKGEETPTVDSFSQSDDKKSLSFSFKGLSGDSTYSVSISGIKKKGSSVELISIFSFVTEHIYEYPKYKSSDAWPADGFAASELKNNDPVWKFLYRNTLTSATSEQYKEYTIAALGGANSEGFARPTENEDGTYNYEATGSGAIVYSDSTANPGMRNAMGKYWSRLSVAGSDPGQSTENRIVKAFIAPESGKIVVSAEDMSGAAKIYNKGLGSGNPSGATVRVIKKSASAGDETLWEHKFIYTDKSIESVDFENITVYLNKGEQLWFVVSGEQAKNGWGMQVFWNPTVRYIEVYPNIVKSEPENNAQGVALNFEHRIEFDREIKDVSIDSIEVDGNAKCKTVSVENGTTLCFNYSGLLPNTKYNVKINDVSMSETTDTYYRTYEYSFTTGDVVQIESISTEKVLSKGNNTVFVKINNSAGITNPYKAALMVCVCKKTANGYDIESAKTVYRDDIGEYDEIIATVSLPDTEQYFIKAVLLQSVSSARAIVPISIFQK